MYFADFDGVEPAQAESQICEAGLPAASAVVMSGTGTHAYWFLIEPEHNIDEWEHRQEWLATAVSSDPAVCDRQRLSRLPGTLNNKPKDKHDPPRSELLRCVKDCRYSWRELQPNCDPLTTPEPQEPTPKHERGNGELLRGDDYTNRTKWQELLPAGWRPVGKVRNGLQAWTHGIGGSRNKSATVRMGDDQRKREDIHTEFMEERSGILNWLLMGLTDWQTRGLQEPDSVKGCHQRIQRGERHHSGMDC